MKIIVKHKDFHVISTIILALTSLLLPLHWCSPMIVILPDNLLDFIGMELVAVVGCGSHFNFAFLYFILSRVPCSHHYRIARATVELLAAGAV